MRVIIGILAAIVCSVSIVSATSLSAVNPKFRVASRVFVDNKGAIDTPAVLTWRRGTEAAPGAVVRTDNVTVVAGARQKFDLSTMADVVAPFDGFVQIDSEQPLVAGYYLPIQTANVRVHDISGVGGTVTIYWVDISGNKVGTPGTFSLTADQEVRLGRDTPVPTQPTGGASLVAEAGFAIEAYHSASLAPTIK